MNMLISPPKKYNIPAGHGILTLTFPGMSAIDIEVTQKICFFATPGNIKTHYNPSFAHSAFYSKFYAQAGNFTIVCVHNDILVLGSALSLVFGDLIIQKNDVVQETGPIHLKTLDKICIMDAASTQLLLIEYRC